MTIVHAAHVAQAGRWAGGLGTSVGGNQGVGHQRWAVNGRVKSSVRRALINHSRQHHARQPHTKAFLGALADWIWPEVDVQQVVRQGAASNGAHLQQRGDSQATEHVNNQPPTRRRSPSAPAVRCQQPATPPPPPPSPGTPAILPRAPLPAPSPPHLLPVKLGDELAPGGGGEAYLQALAEGSPVKLPDEAVQRCHVP